MIYDDARELICELVRLQRPFFRPVKLLAIGCSSSEVLGEKIGTHSSYETAEEIHAAIAPILAEEGLWLAAQCCEHLNRALIIEADLARELRLRQVPTLSITRLGNNTLASVCDENLYIHSITLPARYGVEYEISTPYFILIEYLYLAYQEFLKRRLDSL